MKRIALAIAGVLATALLVVAAPVTANAATTTIPAGTALTVQDQTSAGASVPILLATHTVTTTSANEVRRIATSLPIAHTRSGSVVAPDRFYFVATVTCDSPLDGSFVGQSRNILATQTATLAPNLLVTFPTAGTYDCDLTYKIITSGTYDDVTDDMEVGPGNAVITDTLVTSAWQTQCNWASLYTAGDPSECDYAPGDEGAVAIEFGETSADRTPVVVEIPAGTSAAVRSAATLTTCGGSGGGADMLLCGDALASWRPSAARSNIVVTPVGSSDPGCLPTLSTASATDGVSYADIPVKVHHMPAYNVLAFTTSTQAGCPTTYEVAQRITTTSGETIVMHQTGSILYVH